MRKLPRLLAIGFALALRRTLTFRVNLLFDVVLAVVALLSTLATIMIIFARTERLAGWTRSEVIVLIGTFELVSGIKATFVDPNLTFLSTRAIREGRLDHHLLQPAPSLFLATLGTAAPLAGIQILLSLGVVAVGVHATARPVTIGAVTTWAVLVGAAAAVTWAIGTLLASLAFWAPRLDLQSLFGNAWQLGRYPADIYARPLRLVLTHAVPLALVATIPAGTLTRRAGAEAAAVTAGATGAVLVLLAAIAWRRGLRRYSGAGG
ncbi:MAG TPA: ABC-2 family transporter protein [Actinoplanes sp.]